MARKREKGGKKKSGAGMVRSSSRASGSHAAPAATNQATPPKRFLGGFELLEKVGAGAMGAVFRARQTSLDRIVALKVLPARIAKDKVFIQRFVREARASGNLNHPHIVQGIDVGKDDDAGLWYFAMEFVDGLSVKQLLKKEGRLTEKRALEITLQMAQALKCAERAKIVHRDIKPDNIMLTKRGDAKLADLGLAKRSNEDSSVTQSGMAVGTPHYISPEQAQGEKIIDVRSDIYSLGATLFHMVTGKTPFDGDTAPVIMVHHIKDAPPLAHEVASDISKECGLLIDDMLKKKPSDRIRSAEQLITRINKLSNQTSGQRRANGSKKKDKDSGPFRSPRSARSSGGSRLPANVEGKEPTTGRLRPIRGDTTGPRGAVRTKPSRPASNSNNNSVPLLIGGAALALIIPLLMMSGGSKPPTRKRVTQQPGATKPPRPWRNPNDSPSLEEDNKRVQPQEIKTAPGLVTPGPTDAEEASARSAMDNIRKEAEVERIKQAAIAEAQKRFATLWDKFDAEALNGNFDAAHQLIEQAEGSGTFKDVALLQPLLDLGRNFSRISDAKKLATETLLKLENKSQYGLPKFEKVISISEQEINIQKKFTMNGMVKYRAEAILTSKLPTVAKSFIHSAFGGYFEPFSTTDHLTLGLLAMSDSSHPAPEKNMTWAGTMIKQAGDHPFKNHYLEIQKQRRKKLWAALEAIRGPPSVLFIVSSKQPYQSDTLILRRLEHLGCKVEKRSDLQVDATHIDGKALILISSSISNRMFANKVRTLRLKETSTPIITWEPKLYSALGMALQSGWLKSVSIAACRKTPFTPDIHGPVSLLQEADAMAWGTPGPKAKIIAVASDAPGKALTFAYDINTDMASGQAKGKRIGLFLADHTARCWTEQGARIFDAAIRWSIPRLKPTPFLAVQKVKRTALMVIGLKDNRSGDQAVRARLKQLGYDVTVIRDNQVSPKDSDGKHLVLISSTCSSRAVAGKLKDIPIPVIVWEPYAFSFMGMTINSDRNGWHKDKGNSIQIRTRHPLAASLSGRLVVIDDSQVMPYANLGKSALKIASIVGQLDKFVIFAYDKGAQMATQQAPARRVGFFLSDFSAADLNKNGWALFDAAVSWSTKR